MRVVLTGAAGVGKTTLIKELSKKLNAPIIQEGARKILNKYKTDENIGKFPIKKIIEIQKEILNIKTIETEKKIKKAYKEGYNCILEDRGVMDVLLYSSFWLSREEEAEEYIEELQIVVDEYAHTGKYGRVILIPPVFPLVKDGVRAPQEKFRDTCHYLLLGILENYNYNYVTLKEETLEKRVEECIKIING